MFLNLKRIYFIFCFFVLLSCYVSVYTEASTYVKIENIRYWSSSDYTRVVIDLSGNIEFSQNRISDPERLYFDFANTDIVKGLRTTFQIGDGVLKTVRIGKFNQNTTRVVLDLEEFRDFNVFVLDNPVRLVIDIYGNEKDDERVFAVKRKIVIDPGHGGHDPGAIGPNGLYEKDVVLDIAFRIKKILMQDPINEVYLTRENDKYLSLEERTAFANKKGADLFVSVHANASSNRQAKGIETYLLNWTDDEEAMKVAARENAISLKKMKSMYKQMDTVKVITDDLMRQNKRDESIKLAHYIQKSLITNLDERHNLGVKQALFYVLFGARMPSVLVEVSFISNIEEEKLLSQDSYRMEIAKSISEGILTYFTSIPATQKVAGLKNNKQI
ncbi:MAG: N-acetylmuramoyl-L-alanine amidase [Nitrospirae bacterium]|nr:N-acetylmuramoyl-L-alanine amidase [Nitrospirota bacterium]